MENKKELVYTIRNTRLLDLLSVRQLKSIVRIINEYTKEIENTEKQGEHEPTIIEELIKVRDNYKMYLDNTQHLSDNSREYDIVNKLNKIIDHASV